MRKLIVFMMNTLDGYMAGLNDEIDWHVFDEDMGQLSIGQLQEVDMLLFGRRTYEGMQSYWTTPEAAASDPVITEAMNTLPKIVFSTTLESADWQNTRLIKVNIAEEVNKLKQQPGKDLMIFGSSSLCASLLDLGLIDEVRVMVNPVIIGSGKPLFGGITHPLKLKLIKTRVYHSGNVMCYYEPELI